MRLRAVIAILCSMIPALLAVEIRVATFNIGAHFNETFFDYSLGDPGTPDHDAVRDILARIDADVVALQEIHSVDVQGSPDDLDALAASLGYPYLNVPPVTGVFDNSLRVVFLSRFPFLQSTSIAPPAEAKDMTRRHPVVKVDVPGTDNDLLLVSPHLKAGTELSDRFRRAVEMRRLTGYLAAAGITDDDNFIVLGDFNPSSIHTTFQALPGGLPGTFSLGADITFPVVYSTNMPDYFTGPTAVKLDARQPDGSPATYNTSAPGGPTLDLLLVSPAIASRPFATEIYNSTQDTSNTPGLPKAGAPLAANTSALASDHYAVFADLELDAELPDLDLALDVPSVMEAYPAATLEATVTLPAARTVPVTVSLSTDDPAVTVEPPAQVIPTGAVGAVFQIRVLRNFLADATRAVSLTATANGYDPHVALLSVADADEPYVFQAPGQTLVESFDGFSGNHPPAPWAVTGADPWLGADDGSSAATGWRAYGSGGERAPGFIPSGEARSLTAAFTNQSPTPLTALQVTLDGEPWRSPTGGAADALAVELITETATLPLELLRFEADELPSGQDPVSRTAVAGGLRIAPGQTFHLRVSFLPGSTQGLPPAGVFINEFHYDNTGTDTGEFVEMVVGPGFTGNPADVALVHYNGSDGKVISSHSLGTFTEVQRTSSGHRLFHKPIVLQNDAEGLAVVVGGSVLRFISYEGAFTAVDGPAAGMTSDNIGLHQGGSDPIGQSALGLSGTGGIAADFPWRKFNGIPHSPGQPNDGQVFTNPNKPPRGLAFDNLAVTFLTDHDLDGDPDATDPDDDNDGQPDAHEAAFGSDPRSAVSRFAPAITGMPHEPALTFPGAPGITYVVEMSATLQGRWQELSSHAGAGGSIVVPLPASAPSMFFRVKAAAP